MNDLTIYRPNDGVLTLPAVSPALERALAECTVRTYGDMRLAPSRQPTSAERQEAAAMLAAMRNLAPITPERMARWLEPFMALPSAPQSGLQAAAALCAIACHDLPSAALTRRLQARALGVWKFWPTPAEVRAMVEEAAAEWRARVRDLEAVANARNAPPFEPAREAMSLEQIEANRARVAEVVAEIQAAAELREDAYRAMRPAAMPLRDVSLSPGQLRAAYAAQGRPDPRGADATQT